MYSIHNYETEETFRTISIKVAMKYFDADHSVHLMGGRGWPLKWLHGNA